MLGNVVLRILTDGRFWRGPAPKVIVLLSLANVAAYQWRAGLAEARRANLTTGDVSALDRTCRYDYSFGEDLLATWGDVPDATAQPLVIVCGMSQMFTINEPQPGDQRVAEELDDRLQRQGIHAYGLAAPNLCNEEAFFLLLATLQESRTTPHSFIYGVCFDKFRNIDLRPGYQRFLQARPELAAAWRRTAEEYREQYPLATDKLLKTLVDLQSDKADVRSSGDVWETKLRNLVGAGMPMVAERKELNGFLQCRMHLLRTTLLGIKPTSKRPIIRTRYDMNREFLELMVEVSRRAGVRFGMYVVPLNPLAENPYVGDEYVEFKSWLGNLAAERDIRFANFENLVPTDDWGTWLGGPDFKHFKGAGHRRLAAKIAEEFGPESKTAAMEVGR